MTRFVVVVAFAAVLTAPTPAGSWKVEAGRSRYESVEPHMGTLVKITVYTSGEDDARRAFRAGFDRIAGLEVEHQVVAGRIGTDERHRRRRIDRKTMPPRRRVARFAAPGLAQNCQNAPTEPGSTMNRRAARREWREPTHGREAQRILKFASGEPMVRRRP